MADVSSRDPGRVQRGARTLSRTPVFDAVLRNGVSATLIGGGMRHNVIPTEASATLDVRTLPGQSLDGVIARLRRAVRDPLVRFTVVEREADAPAITESVRELNPALAVVPYLSTGATDSARLRRLGVQAFGILPFPMTQEDEDRMHGNDERIPLDSLHFGTRLVYGAVWRVAR
jgi:acetylornithine deacetylase/succinyl-diaminopimelate desuccinylase-like protein